MATLTSQKIVRTGLAPTYAAAAAGLSDKFTPGPQTFLHVKNTNGATRTVSVATVGAPIPDLTKTFAAVSLPATTGDKMIGPFPPEHFQGSDGLATITWSVDTGVTVAVLDLSSP